MAFEQLCTSECKISICYTIINRFPLFCLLYVRFPISLSCYFIPRVGRINALFSTYILKPRLLDLRAGRKIFSMLPKPQPFLRTLSLHSTITIAAEDYNTCFFISVSEFLFVIFTSSYVSVTLYISCLSVCR
jgi:hypothetical protein